MHEDEFGCPSVGADDEGCCFPGECCIPWPHTRNECVTAEMMEEFEKEMSMEHNEGMTRRPTCGSENERLRAALRTVKNLMPSWTDGGAIGYVHVDSDGTENGIERVDPVALIAQVDGIVSKALEV